MENGNSLERFAEEPRPNTSIEKRRSASQKINELGKILLGWGIIGSSFLPGIENALARRESEPWEEEKSEYVDPEIQKRETNLVYLRNLFGEEQIQKLYYPDSTFRASKDAYSQIPTAIYRGRREAVDLEPEAGKDLGLKGEEFRDLFVRSYPGNFVDTDVRKIVLEPGYVDSTDQYGFKMRVAGEAPREVYGSTINLYPSRLEEAVGVYSHELGHANDFIADVNLPPDVKTGFWRRATENYLNNPKRLRSAYVEDIKTGLFDEVVEYWGELAEEYFGRPGALKREHPKDFVLFNEWVLLQDPTFDPFAAARERQKLISMKKIEREFQGLPVGLQNSLESMRQDLLVRHGLGGADRWGLFNHTEKDIDRVKGLCHQYGLQDDSRRDLRIAYALWGSFDYQTNRDYQP